MRRTRRRRDTPERTEVISVRALIDGAVAVRDSKHPTDATLTVTSQAWTAFITAIRNGEFD